MIHKNLVNNCMRAKEFINEDIGADGNKFDDSVTSAIKGALSLPGISINKSNGSPYQGYRFGLALAGSHSDPAKQVHTPAAGAMAGDPLVTVYTQEEYEMVANAAKEVMAGPVKQITSMASEEKPDTYKVSPTAKPKRNKYGV
jgi:hypothetical protein